VSERLAEELLGLTIFSPLAIRGAATARGAARSLILLIGCVAAIGGPALAESTIRVLVNDEPITSFDIDQRARIMALTGEKGGAKVATEQLIDEVVELAEAKFRRISIPDARVDAAFASISQKMKLSAAQLTEALGTKGIVADSLKRRIKVQMAWSQIVQARMRFDVSVKSSDVEKALLAEAGDPKQLKTTEYTLQQIIFVMPKGSSAAYGGQRRREAESFRLRFAGCDKSIEQAKGLKDVAVKSLGRRLSDELSGSPDGKDIVGTPAGKTTRPTQIDVGVALIAVCSTRELATDSGKRNEIENKLTLEQGKDVGKDYLKQLRDKAIIKYR
jgi:peptidyl-prolyl cis-trans isomerase SurA